MTDMDKPITIKELKEFIKDLDDNVECFIDHEDSKKMKPIYDVGLLTQNSTYKKEKIKKLIFDLRCDTR